MWVADMDLAAPPEIQNAIIERARHPTFGYTIQPPQLWTAVAKWLHEQHNWVVEPEQFVFTSNLVSSTVNALHVRITLMDLSTTLSVCPRQLNTPVLASGTPKSPNVTKTGRPSQQPVMRSQWFFPYTPPCSTW